jgi:hypothetical protein
MGQPMSHSTQFEFRVPPAWAVNVGVFLVDSLGAFVSFAMCAVGVVHRCITAVARPSPLVLLAPLRLWFPHTVGVGQYPDSVSLVRRSHIGSPQHSPFRIEPQRGQVSENSTQSPSSECWRVFHEHKTGLYFTHDSGHFHPESASLSGDSCAPSGCGYVLAGKSSRNHVNATSPRRSVKRTNVIPYWEWLKLSVVLSRDKYASGERVILNGADCSPSEKLSGENSSASPREQCKLS